jgi:hypothetical protein
MKPVPIPTARKLATETGATRLVILGIDDNGVYAYTTFGKTKAQCDALRIWADRHLVEIGMDMHEETLP